MKKLAAEISIALALCFAIVFVVGCANTQTQSSATSSQPSGSSSSGSSGSSSGSGSSSTPTPTPTPTPPPTPTPTPTPTPDPTGLPTPPSTAKVFTNIDQRTGWGSCNQDWCAGGTGTGSYWMAQNQTSPSRDGNSMEVYNSGVWANALWWQKVGSNNTATNFLWDFYAQVDSASVNAGQALEYDPFQFVGGYNYMMGTQCNLAAKLWDVWDELNGHWIHTSIPCPKFDPDVWHHVQVYTQTDHSAHTYTYVTLVVDGTSYSVNKTYSAKDLGWRDDLGVQYQLDVNASGTGYHEWIDSSTLTVW